MDPFSEAVKRRGENLAKPLKESLFFFFLCEFKVVSSRHTIAAAIVKRVAYPSKPLLSLLSKLSDFLIMFWLGFRSCFYSRKGRRVRRGRGEGK